jgi:hypothetical protein
MRRQTCVVICGLALCAWTTSSATVRAQARGAGSGTSGVQGGRTGGPTWATRITSVPDDPFQGPVVTNAPFSADGVTTVTQVLSDGTRIEENTTAKFYRDSAGRLRREQTILGLAALNPSGEPRVTITIDPDPGDTTAYTLDPITRTARRGTRSAGPVVWLSGAGGGPVTASTARFYVNGTGLDGYRLTIAQPADVTKRGAIDVGGLSTPGAVPQPPESLGTRQMEGVTVVGRRTKSVIPTGQIGNDRPIEITDERWESPDLKLLVRSHHHDPRTGDVEYRLMNILRVDPSPDLFQIPPDYTVQGSPAVLALPVLKRPGEQQGGAGARGDGAARSGAQRSGAPAN